MSGSTTNPIGFPTELSGNNCVVIQFGSSLYQGQLAFGFGNPNIARRFKAGSSEWSEWYYYRPN